MNVFYEKMPGKRRNMKKRISALLLCMMLVLSIITACGKSNTNGAATSETVTTDTSSEIASSTEAATDDAKDSNYLNLKDPAGNEIKVPVDVKSIVSMAPSTTRVLLDLGLSDKIIACDTNSAMSYGSELKEDIPQFDMMNPDNEAIVSLNPDIVFTSGMSAAKGSDVFAPVRTANICIADIPTASTLDEIYKDMNFIGICVGKQDEANQLSGEMKEVVSRVEEISVTIPESERKAVLYEISTPTADYPDIYSAAKDTYIDEIIKLIGAKNIAHDNDTPWPALSEEACIAADPDVIISGDTYTEDPVSVILSTSGWENVKAIQNKAVYVIDGNKLNQPNHHVADSILEIAILVYPEYYNTLSK